MSEYQYYEFQKVDGRLTEKEMHQLRSYSTRAEITPSSFINEYHFGEFKGNTGEWMNKYFDGFLYFSNWGTREVQLAVPAALLPPKTAKKYCSSRAASSREKSGKLILTFLSEDESGEEWIEGESYLSSLLQIRNELSQGDLRSLYLVRSNKNPLPKRIGSQKEVTDGAKEIEQRKPTQNRSTPG